ncbi:MgtC/SapB family protein [Pseudoduganella sp. FT25W]|jgi:putative Mg2+ transporter-C (MgtC) family protein|uniref:Protein MgtC n=1 Tax=Duganella alba TaxID=2666081 RepID=A0A6L5QAV2_9BURK|nr:MgtC/SapB family protein [Duganella alba]MRX06923.1 MgtC/SapB family protein [Duganella alba]MRX16180.1 MgtC/SapB family protein [Duganella alba]
MPPIDFLTAYWSQSELATNLVILLNLLGALLLGLMVGYERSYHGRAAGMRTYGLVCMASAALTVIGGYPSHWFGGHVSQYLVSSDPTRIVQGIVTGIGFLGAGVIMREGFNISGLTTAASIWASSVIGVMVGVGFYMGAMGLALLCAGSMVFLTRVEAWLPSRHAIAITMRFRTGYKPQEQALRTMALQRGYEIAGGSLMIGSDGGMQEWRFVAIAFSKRSGAPMSVLSAELAEFEGIHSFQLTHARN